MICFFCKGEMESGITNHVVNISNGVIVIKNVPCTECQQCGQSFYDDDVMMRLEVIVNEMRKSATEVAVISYSDRNAA